ncbi:c-type cytochrome [Pokkaliibacter plantistimulans]|nr:c-type cytochrome [Pokkaliibacter plantistimulans]
MRKAIGLVAMTLSVLASGVKADVCEGVDKQQAQTLYTNNCSVCHSVEPAGAVMMGPNLHGVVNRDVASVAGFNYSQALKNAGGQWQAERLDQFIQQPQSAMPGTYMPFAGLADASQRKAIICYLSQHS